MLNFLQFVSGSLRPLAAPVAVNALALALRSVPYLIVYLLLERFLQEGGVSLPVIAGFAAAPGAVLLAHYAAVVYYLPLYTSAAADEEE